MKGDNASMRAEKYWLPIVIQQESALVFKQFHHEDALNIGLIIARRAHDYYCENVSVKIVFNAMTVFSYMMEYTSLEHEWWMLRKANTLFRTQVSSLRAFLEFEYGIREKAGWCENIGNYAICGGCFPLFVANEGLCGYFAISGLKHFYDHQLIVDALSEYLHVEVPVVE